MSLICRLTQKKNYVQTVDNLDRTPASVPPRLRDEPERGKPPPKQRLEAPSSSADEKNDGLQVGFFVKIAFPFKITRDANCRWLPSRGQEARRPPPNSAQKPQAQQQQEQLQQQQQQQLQLLQQQQQQLQQQQQQQQLQQQQQQQQLQQQLMREQMMREQQPFIPNTIPIKPANPDRKAPDTVAITQQLQQQVLNNIHLAGYEK